MYRTTTRSLVKRLQTRAHIAATVDSVPIGLASQRRVGYRFSHQSTSTRTMAALQSKLQNPPHPIPIAA